MPSYLKGFLLQDQKRVFGFLALFSRLECALKRSGFARSGAQGQAEPDWKAFAESLAQALASVRLADFIAAREYLVSHPPNRQVIEAGGIVWKENPRRPSETDTMYLLRVVRDVRNNLFHGGKYHEGPIEEIARDRKLIDQATTVLEVVVELDGKVRGVFLEAA